MAGTFQPNADSTVMRETFLSRGARTPLVRAEQLLTRLAHSSLALAILYSLIVLPVVIAIASTRPLWFDEIYTYYLAHFNLSQLWNALLAAADQMPPLFDILTRVLFSLFGENKFIERLPSIIAFWLAGLLIFRYVSFRTWPLWGFLGALFPFATASIYYASEARPYSFLVCFTALAMVAWQNAAANHHRKLALFLLTLANLLVINSHYYGLLLIVPLLAGELVRALERKRLDWPVLACSILPFAFILVYWPFIRNSERLLSGHAWNAPSLSSFYEPFTWLFGAPVIGAGAVGIDTAAILWGVLAIAVMVSYLTRHDPVPQQQSTPRIPLHEAVAPLALALLPFPAVIAALTKTHLIHPRYVLEMIVGIAILFGFACHRLGRANTLFGFSAAALIALCILGYGVKTLRNTPPPDEACPAVPQSGPTASWPVVIDDPILFLRCYYYAPPAMKARIKYLSGPKETMARESVGHWVPESLIVAAPVFHVPVVWDSDFRAAHRQFYLQVVPESYFGWLVNDSLHRGATLQLYKPNLFIVTNPHPK